MTSTRGSGVKVEKRGVEVVKAKITIDCSHVSWALVLVLVQQQLLHQRHSSTLHENLLVLWLA